MSFFSTLYLDKKLTDSLGPYIDSEVERLTNNIVNAAVREKLSQLQYDNLLLKESNSTEEYMYNIKQINYLKQQITNYIQEVLFHLDEANIEDEQLFNQLKTSKFKKIKNGILAENSISSLRGSTLFGNIGPTVPIRLYFVGQVASNIEIQTKEYGINNLMVEIDLIIIVKEQVMMPLSSKIKEIKIKEVLGLNIIQGTIPDYYNSFSK